MWHPASLLVLWAACACALAWLSSFALAASTALCLAVAFVLAPHRVRGLLWRTRWLVLSLAVLFLFFTPGEYLPDPAGRLGMTREGLVSAGEHVARLLALLATLALLHERIGTNGLLAGLYRLLGPFAWRSTTVVRLMLVLDYVERQPQVGWRGWLAQAPDPGGPESFTLTLPPLRLRDRLAIVLLLVAVLAMVVWP